MSRLATAFTALPLLMAAPLAAQTPPPPPPPNFVPPPPNVPPLNRTFKPPSFDLIEAAAYATDRVTYVRLGVRPTHYRLGLHPEVLKNNGWTVFTESNTSQVTVGGRTMIQGNIPLSPGQALLGFPGYSCPAHTTPMRIFLQFKLVRQGTPQILYPELMSPIRGDTSCVAIDG